MSKRSTPAQSGAPAICPLSSTPFPGAYAKLSRELRGTFVATNLSPRGPMEPPSWPEVLGLMDAASKAGFCASAIHAHKNNPEASMHIRIMLIEPHRNVRLNARFV